MVFQRISKGKIISIRLKNGFLTLGNEINEGIRNNIWYCGVLMNKRNFKNESKMEAREGRRRGMHQYLTWIFMEYQRLGEGNV